MYAGSRSGLRLKIALNAGRASLTLGEVAAFDRIVLARAKKNRRRRTEGRFNDGGLRIRFNSPSEILQRVRCVSCCGVLCKIEPADFPHGIDMVGSLGSCCGTGRSAGNFVSQ